MYATGMTRRTTVEIDDAQLHAAQVALGTTGLKDTVDAALREVIRSAKRRRLADRLAAGEGFDRDPLAAESRAKNWGT